ncbi:MAG: hypothetical protein OEZ39_09400 [Gammaproteobacteria bacterium]|nr:hypothetical protein [Gammaproteobacteria bacterium]
MFSLVCLFVIIYAAKLGVLRHPAFILNYVFAVFIVLFSFSEVLFFNEQTFYINSDEVWFANEAKLSLLEIWAKHTRYFLYIAYSHTTYLLTGEWGFKLQSVPFALLIALILYDGVKKIEILWLFPFFLGYIFFISTLNMRDTMVICIMLFYMLKISTANVKWLLVLSLVVANLCLYIRPEYFYVCFLLMFWVLISRTVRGGLFVLCVIPSFFIIFSYIYIGDLVFSIAKIIYPVRIDSYLNETAVEITNVPFMNSNAASIVRQLLTPLPSSKINYFLTQGLSQNLFLLEFFRIIMMTSYYIMALMLMYKWRSTYAVMRDNIFLHAIFIMAVINTLLYAIYRDGGGASRNKLYPIILVLCLFVSVYKIKTKSIQKNIVVREEIINTAGTANA